MTSNTEDITELASQGPYIDCTTCGDPIPVPSAILKKNKLELLDLNDDCLELIFDHIRRPFHLMLCLFICKDLHRFALKRLYKSFPLFITRNPWGSYRVGWGGTTIHKYSAALHKDNPGLKEIREVQFYTEPELWRMNGISAVLVKLMRLLPEGQLRDFSFLQHDLLPGKVGELIWRRQRKIETLYVHDGLHDVSSLRGNAVGADWRPFPNVKRLVSAPQDAEALDAVSRALACCDVTELFLDGARCAELAASMDPDTGTVTYEVTTRSFQHLEPGTQWSFLRRLWLIDVDLRYPRQTWLSHLLLENLETLDICHCSHADLFLFESVHQGAPKLKDFTLIHKAHDGHADRIVTALEDFLTHCKGRLRLLKLVVRELQWPEYPDAGLINRHRETLEILFLDLRYESNHMAVPPECERLLRGCAKLTQLAVNLPAEKAAPAHQLPPPGPHAGIVGPLGPPQAGPGGAFAAQGPWPGPAPGTVPAMMTPGQLVNHIFDLVDLRVFNPIFEPYRLPDLSSSWHAADNNRPFDLTVYHYMSIANHIFYVALHRALEHRRRPYDKLKIVAFGVNEVFPGTVSPAAQIFTRVQFDKLGQSSGGAWPVVGRQLILEGVDVELLEYAPFQFDEDSRRERTVVDVGDEAGRGWDEDDVWGGGHDVVNADE